LLTRGISTLGVTDPSSIVSSVRVALDASECPWLLHTIGLSDCPNAKLLNQLAHLGSGGSFHYGPNKQCIEESLADIFWIVQDSNDIKLVSNGVGNRSSAISQNVLECFQDMTNCANKDLWRSIAVRLHEATELLTSPHQQKVVHVMSSLSYESLQCCDWVLPAVRSLEYASEDYIAAVANWIHQRGVSNANSNSNSDTDGSNVKRLWPQGAAEDEGECVAASALIFGHRFKVSHDLFGKGAYGSIFTARDIKTGKEVKRDASLYGCDLFPM
jgi:hypothetical protein